VHTHPLGAEVFVDHAAFQQSETHARLVGDGRIVFADTAEALKVWNATRRQRWGFDWHSNEGLEFLFVERGRLGFGVGGDQRKLSPGDLVITRPWQLHRVGNPMVDASQVGWLVLDVGVREPAQAWRWPEWLVCSHQDLERLVNHLENAPTPIWRGSADVVRCFQRLRAVVNLEDAAQVTARIKLLVNELLIASLELLEVQHSATVALTNAQEPVRRFLFTTLPDQIDTDWTLNRMAAASGLGRSQFTHHCLLLTNMTPVEYLNHCRIQFAARLLRTQPGLSITDIGFRCGFNSSQYFARSFRAHEGCTPSEYRSGRIGLSTLDPGLSLANRFSLG
jgi:AraC-like DNA-binding protein/quercetin dioxygenase-like cupin family protein